MKASEHERHDWIIILIILLIGFLCVMTAGQWALRFSPSWKLDANMESNLDPNSDFLTRKPSGFIEPVDSSILTQPFWINVFLTPGAVFSTGTPLPPATGTSFATSTTTNTLSRTPTPISTASVTNTTIVIVSPTNTLIYFPPIPSSTPQPQPSSTFTAAPTYTFIATVTHTSTSTSTPTTATATFTSTADPFEPDFGAPDGNVYMLMDGTCLFFDFGTSNAIAASGASEPAYDLVYYEKAENLSVIFMDWVTINVAESSSGPWYPVFNWGDLIPDTNSNVSGITENDNQPINMSLVYGTPPLQTGIAIDIDGASVPAGTYQWLEICASSGGNGDGLEIDSIEVLP